MVATIIKIKKKLWDIDFDVNGTESRMVGVDIYNSNKFYIFWDRIR